VSLEIAPGLERECISAGELQNKIQARLRKLGGVEPLVDPDLRVVLERQGARLAASFWTPSPRGTLVLRRELSTNTECHSLDDALVFVGTLVVQGGEAAAPSARERPMVPPSATAASSASPAASVSSSAPRFLPSPPIASASSPSSSAPSLPPPVASPAEPPSQAPPTPDPPTSTRWDLLVGGTVERALLPGYATGISLSSYRGNTWILGARITYLAPVRLSIDPGSAQLWSLTGWLGPCVRGAISTRAAMGLCTGVEGGVIHAKTQDLVVTASLSRAVVAGTAESWFELNFGNLLVRLGGGLVVPIIRDSFFVYDRDGTPTTIHQASRAGGRGDLAVGWRFQ
jgi:hypothetical protein